MGKKTTVILGLLLALSDTAFARIGPPVPFRVGEKLTYQIFWGPFVVGRASLEVAGIEKVDNHDCYHLIAKARTSGLAEWLFPVDSTAESWLDCQELYTRRYRENRSEGKHVTNDETRYDYGHMEAITKNRKGREKRLPLDQPVQDVISSVYFVRAQKLMLDAEQTFVLNAGATNYTVTIRPDERKEIWLRPVGDVQALRIEPNPTLKIVAANNGRMWFWVSDDDRRLPLLVNSELRFGNAKLVLFSVGATQPPSATSNGPASAAAAASALPKPAALASGR